MCSQKRLEANRRNALKSTGPKTDEGKSRSSQNALKHGLTAQTPVVLDEKQEDFKGLADAIRQDLRPRGAMEELLVQRIILASWKLQRTVGAEVDAMTEASKFRETKTVAETVSDDVASGSYSSLARIQMYEMRLERSLHAALRQLAALQKIRNAQDDADKDELPLPSGEGRGEGASNTGDVPSTPDSLTLNLSQREREQGMQNEPIAAVSQPPRRLAG